MNMFGNFNTQFMASFVGHLKSSILVVHEAQIFYTIYDDYNYQITHKWLIAFWEEEVKVFHAH